MTVAVYLPLVASLLVGIAVPWLVARARSAAPLHVLAVTATVVTAAAGSTWSLVLLVATLIDDVPVYLGHHAVEPVSDGIALAALAGLAVGTIRALRTIHRRRRTYRALRAACAQDQTAEIAVLDDAQPIAFALPGKVDRIVVSSGMLRVLDPAQRRVLYAHERAHLHDRHHLLLGAADLAAAFNPALIRARDAVAFACERRADEHAATETGDRRLTAASLAAAALAGAGRSAPMSFGQHQVLRRVTALRTAPAGAGPLPVLAAAAACLVILAFDADATVAFVRFAVAVVTS